MHRTLAVPLVSLGLALVSSPAVAAPPPPSADAFEVQYLIPEPDGGATRLMSEVDRTHFFNQARCECGQPLRTRIRGIQASEQIDVTKPITAMLGTACDVAESNPDAQFKPCGELMTTNFPSLVVGAEIDAHPLFLAAGVDGPSRDVDDPDTVVAGSCEGRQGRAGAWLCVQTNTVVGCQQDEFILAPDEQSGVAFDFVPPITVPTNLTAQPADSGVTLEWQTISGDIHGFRVLCEIADSGEPLPDRNYDPPEPTALPDGTHYFTSHDLCGDAPFVEVQWSTDGPDGSACGDGRLGPGEQCDDGEDNRDGGLCSAECQLNVSAGLHALEWDHVCSGHLATTTRTVNIDGLNNDTTYNFVLVAYDRAGNPRAVASVVQATPGEQYDPLPGAGSGCRSAPGERAPAALLLLGLGLLARRRRLTARTA
jgi:MYXO-CTERM domain-containing protein